MSKIDLHKAICEEMHTLYKRKNNDYGDSISDLVRKVKGKCEIEMFWRKMLSVVIMFLVGNVKMYTM